MRILQTIISAIHLVFMWSFRAVKGIQFMVCNISSTRCTQLPCLRALRSSSARGFLFQPWLGYVHYFHLGRAAPLSTTYAYKNLRTYIPTYLPTYLHTYMHTCIHTTYLPTYLHTSMHTYMHTYIHTYIHTSMHACMHACIQPIYIYRERDTCLHVYIYMYISCIYMYICARYL